MTEATLSAVHRDLDLVRFIRAKRMHAFGMFFSLSVD
jgi:hypothetical protein